MAADDARLQRPSRSSGTRGVLYSIVRGCDPRRRQAARAGRGASGSEHVPDGAFVLAPVHRSNIDFALASLVTQRRMRYMGKDSLWKSKALGAFVSFLGGFPVQPRHRRPRGAADLHRRHRGRRAARDVPRGHAPLRSRRRGAVRRPRLRGREDAGADRSRRHRRLRGDDAEGLQAPPARRSSCSSSASRIEPPAPNEGGRVLTPRRSSNSPTSCSAELQKLFDDAQSRAAPAPAEPPCAA